MLRLTSTPAVGVSVAPLVVSDLVSKGLDDQGGKRGQSPYSGLLASYLRAVPRVFVPILDISTSPHLSDSCRVPASSSQPHPGWFFGSRYRRRGKEVKGKDPAVLANTVKRVWPCHPTCGLVVMLLAQSAKCRGAGGGAPSVLHEGQGSGTVGIRIKIAWPG